LLAVAVAVEVVLVGAATIIVWTVAVPLPAGARNGVAALLAIAMGVQNAVARSLAVPDLTTTVLTMVLTGVAADLRAGVGGAPAIARRLLAVVAMFAGATVGALLIVHGHTPVVLGVAVGLLVIVAAAAGQADRRVRPAGLLPQ
jgi:uncharacterized membrane protein YoaK (UPF0700 family)